MPNTTDTMAPLPYRVRRTFQETADAFTMELEPANGHESMTFAAGQFNMLYAFGVGEVPISISGDPTRPQALVHTTRTVGTVTRALKKLKKGDLVGVRGPFGTAWPLEEAKGKDVVLVCGGIGLPPLRGAICQILENRDQYGKFVLLYGARSPRDIMYPQDLEQWRGRFDMDVAVTVDRAEADWRGNVGVVTRLIPHANFDPQNAVAMIVGPEIMMRYTIMELQKRGIPDARIFVSMERNMKCGVGLCGHCQCGPTFICKDGPVYTYAAIGDWLKKREI